MRVYLDNILTEVYEPDFGNTVFGIERDLELYVGIIQLTLIIHN